MADPQNVPHGGKAAGKHGKDSGGKGSLECISGGVNFTHISKTTKYSKKCIQAENRRALTSMGWICYNDFGLESPLICLGRKANLFLVL